jgi:hypothetical protein
MPVERRPTLPARSETLQAGRGFLVEMQVCLRQHRDHRIDRNWGQRRDGGERHVRSVAAKTSGSPTMRPLGSAAKSLPSRALQKFKLF